MALVNSRRSSPSGDVDDLASPDQVKGWLAARGLPVVEGTVTRSDVATLDSLRASAREILTALPDARTPVPDAVTSVNLRAASAPGAVQLTWHEGERPCRSWRSAAQGRFDAAAAAIAADTIRLATGTRAALVRRCAAHGCVRVFLRTHARRRWCSNICGDRVRARRHYHRHQSPH
ncbi:hypothetical protein FNH06_03420 [Amycolatopsis acidiphila]|uniref:C2H2-type domain-containing protein n=1 Tax=Amycolatopsis acidiphila TaxID=715473 RepID=A0A558AMA7_9PSEU|nr:hypothetical protein FNH06_03420 [Amycolatopsis acidiphila]